MHPSSAKVGPTSLRHSSKSCYSAPSSAARRAALRVFSRRTCSGRVLDRAVHVVVYAPLLGQSRPDELAALLEELLLGPALGPQLGEGGELGPRAPLLSPRFAR